MQILDEIRIGKMGLYLFTAEDQYYCAASILS